MIRRAVAVRFDRRAESGRTEPYRVAVETDNGEECEVFLKPSAAPGMDIEGLANEAFSACLAGALGLPVCQPFLVEMSEEWIESIQDAPAREVAHRSCPIAFASTAAGDGWRPWAKSDSITLDRRDAAVGIFAFDAFIENPDRRPDNPNVLIKGPAFRIIDHELAFRLRMIIPRPRPWIAGGLNRLTGPDGHAFYAGLRGTKALDFGPVRTAWSAISDASLADYEASLPAQWAQASDAIADALTHVRAVRDRIDDCLIEMERILT